MRTLVLMALACLFAIGCNIKDEKKSESYTYKLNENGCERSASFDSKSAYCQALLQEANSSCVSQLAEARYKSECL